ncbi:uncharacterized protein [Lolium perenne]|uniref:uncharacterized protein n=1 Tax=Lolium perenne TaxID=4522 RepID=UPI0021F5EE19|nr:uncharacterized protein LOC127316879 [Lolium perenne]
MSKHPTNLTLVVLDFDDAVKQVIELLRESDDATEGKIKAFILSGGWNFEGLGACAIIRAIAKLLKSTICDDSDMRNHFGKIFHVDCSLWKNKRTMQRAIAEELNLRHVMPIFDKQDEDDDFRGVEDSSREEISSIGHLINESLRNEKFLMIFHYGGVGDIDLAGFGIPIFGKGKLLCTDEVRFQVTRTAKKLMPSFANIFIYPLFTDGGFPRRALHEEAVGVIGDIGMEGINLAIVLDCFFYSLILTAQLPENSIGVDNGWATHACNYWICDGILGEERAWEIGNALYRVMTPLGYSSDGTRRLLRGLDIQETEQNVCWWYPAISNKLGAKNICNVPDCATSYFLTFQGDDPVYVRNDLFELASRNLHVLKLCNCRFDFASPPFQSCHNLRFLWLHNCANTEKEKSGVPIFSNLLVFDLRFTDYVMLPHMVELMTNLRELNTKGISWKTMSHAWKRLQKLHKLRVTESSDVVTVDSCSSIDMLNLELLDMSGNTHMESLPTLVSSARSLKMLVLDGCSSLQNVVLEGVPLLESFSFDGYGPVKNWIHSIQLPQKELRLKSPIAPVEIVQVTKISLQGCGRLQNIFLRALPNLEELDLSGTAIKMLTFPEMYVLNLKKLFLMGCEQLRSLDWGYEIHALEVLQVDTQKEARSVVCCGEQGSFGLQACIAFSDGRFIWSAIQALLFRFVRENCKAYLLISSMSHSQANITVSVKGIGSSQEGLFRTIPLLPYNNITLTEDVACLSLAWNQRQLQTLDVHMEIGEGSYNLESMQDNKYFRDLVGRVQSLHVHDNSSIMAIPPTDEGSWDMLVWCHVERCPRLHTLFYCQRGERLSFEHIRTFSASDLLVAYCIWARGSAFGFQQLQHIYLYNCPRLVFVLPISFTLPNLETLHMAYCSSLRHVFPLDDKCPEEIASGVTFKNLKHIKLYHLHNLEQICEARLTAPALQTISLRDCWGVRRLPAIAPQGPKPVVDCEKDWWNKLEWDGLDAGHDPSLFETRHSAYYKKTLPRVSFLR